MSCKQEEVASYLERIHSDPHREEELGSNDKLLIPEEPNTEFDESDPKLKEVADIIKKARAASASGPCGIPYKVYKNCPRVRKRLWGMMRVARRRGRLAEDWQPAEGCFMPKGEKATNLEDFFTISLLNVEGEV